MTFIHPKLVDRKVTGKEAAGAVFWGIFATTLPPPHTLVVGAQKEFSRELFMGFIGLHACGQTFESDVYGIYRRAIFLRSSRFANFMTNFLLNTIYKVA